MSRILIVDDNAQNLYLARFLLEQRRHEVAEARNGEEAVEAVKVGEFDLLLMDVQMPVMNGLEATRRIKAAGNAPLIVALTAKAMVGDRQKILAAGCDGYIVKPIEPETFSGEVQAYLDGSNE